MKKIIKSRIFLCIIVGVCCLGMGVYGVTKYKANEVLYSASNGKTMNVNEALNELYNDYVNKNDCYIISIKNIYASNSKEYNIEWNSSSVLNKQIVSPTGYGTTTGQITGKTDSINLFKNLDNEEGLLSSISLEFNIAYTGGGSVGDSKLTFYLYDSNNQLLEKFEYKNKGNTRLDISLLDYKIETDSVYITYDGYLQANGFTDSVMAWETGTSFDIADSLTLKYK